MPCGKVCPSPIRVPFAFIALSLCLSFVGADLRGVSSQDCLSSWVPPACNGNGLCERGERCDTCPSDCPPAKGCWSSPMAWPERGIHMSLMHNGKVLWWGEDRRTFVWDPQTNACEPGAGCGTDMCDGVDILCAGHSTLADGRLFVVGGMGPIVDHEREGIPNSSMYDPQSGKWSRRADMKWSRWYPTSTILPDGRVLVMAGSTSGNQGSVVEAVVPEIYDPRLNLWSELPARPTSIEYPFNFVLPDGRILYGGPGSNTGALDLATSTWTSVPGAAGGHNHGSAATYRPGMVLTLGGETMDSGVGQGAVELLNMNVTSPTWVPVPTPTPPPEVRSHLNVVLLPDGNALVVGGGKKNFLCDPLGDPACAVFSAEEWQFARGDPGNPAKVLHLLLNPMQRPRLYHSTALLLPDGRVVVAGGENLDCLQGESNAEIFSPPYLTSGVARPVITSAPASIAYGTYFDISTPTSGVIPMVSLVRPGAVTHGFDQNQRYVPLQFVRQVGYVRALAPANSNIAPPGPYMLFIFNGSWVPSVGQFIQVGSTTPLGPACDNDGKCELAEDCSTCPNDCGVVSGAGMCLACCGNDFCEEGESSLTCPADCIPNLPAMKIADVAFSCVKSGRSVKGRARVLIVDATTGAPVQYASVSGQWTGAVTEGGGGITDYAGWATITTYNGRRPPATFNFSVTYVSHPTYSYQPLLDVETGGEITCGS